MPNSGAANVILDADLRYVSGNEAAFAMVGKTRDEVIGQRHLDLFPETLGSAAHQAMLDALRTLQVQRTRIFSIPLQRSLDLEIHPMAGRLHVVVRPVEDQTP